MTTNGRTDDDPAFDSGQRDGAELNVDPHDEDRLDIAETQDDFDEHPFGAGDDDPDEAPVFTATRLRAAVDAAKDEAQNRYLRLLAEYDNFRKRTERERSQLAADALGDFVRDLLPVFDSLDKACALAADDKAGLSEGLALIRRQLEAALPKHRIETHDPRGAAFDPRVHEALTQQPTEESKPGTVLDVFEKGYSIDGRLLRPARVVVAAKPS